MDPPPDNRLGHGSRAKRIVAIGHLLVHKPITSLGTFALGVTLFSYLSSRHHLRRGTQLRGNRQRSG
jgi:hypothetical protein